MSSRRLQDMSSRRLQDMSSRRLQRNNFSSSKTSSRRLQDVLEDVKLLRWRRVEDVFKTSWRLTNVCWESFIKPCLFHWGYEPWGILHWCHNAFPLGLYSTGAINHVFSTGAIFKQSLNSYVLFSVSHMRYLEATTERYSFKTRTHWIKIRTHCSDRENQHHPLSDVKLLHW